MYEKVGLYGDDVDAILDDAKAALAGGDTELARAKAHQAVDTIDASAGVGRSRVLTAGLTLAGLVLLTLALVIVRRHRHRHPDMVTADEASDASPTAAEGAAAPSTQGGLGDESEQRVADERDVTVE